MYQRYLERINEGTSTFTTFTQKAGAAVKSLGAALGSMAINWAIGELIGLIATSIDKYGNASKHAAENAKTLSSAMTQSIHSMSGDASTLSKLNDEYQKLSNGVNKLGENVNLTTEDYDRYKDIISQVSSIMPNMTTYFNEQGEKIAFAKGRLEDLNKEYNKYIQNQAVDYVTKGDGDGNTIQDILNSYNSNKEFTGFEKFWNGLKNAHGDVNSENFATEEIINELENFKNREYIEDSIQKLNKHLVETFNPLHLAFSIPNLYDQDTALKRMIINELGLDGKTQADIAGMTEAEFNALMQKITAHIQNYNAKITSDMNQVTAALIQQAYSTDSYWAIENQDIKNDIITFLSSITNDVWDELNKAENFDFTAFVNKIITSMSENTNGFADAWNQMFDPELKNLSPDEYAKQINGFLKTVCNALGMEKADGVSVLKIGLGFENVDAIAENYHQAMKTAVKKFSNDSFQYTVKNELEAFAKQNSINTQDEVSFWMKCIEESNTREEAMEKYLESFTEKMESQTFDLTAYQDQIDSIQSSLSTLRSALDALNTGTLDASAVLDLMQQFPSLVSYIDLTTDGFGRLSEGLSDLISQQPDFLIQSLQKLKASLSTDREREQVNLLIASLQRLSSYGDSGIEAYAATIGSTWNDTSNVIEGITTQFESLAKVQEIVADGLTLSVTAAAELAKMYPEILTNAKASANGQITLNEDVVKNILDGDKSIIDAQITKLKADKAELTAKKEAAEAQLNILKQVGEGEGRITRETAQYVLETEDKKLIKTIELGSEQDKVYAEVAKNMASNMNEYNRIVAQVAEDTSTNMVNAAVSMADTMKKNMLSAQLSVIGLIKKLWDMVDAINGLEKGKVSGSLKLYEGGSSSKSKAVKAETHTGDFNTAAFDYTQKEINLDAFRSQLEIDIKGYEDSISNIDSQIEILRNLQASFDNNGGIGGHGYTALIEQLEKEKGNLAGNGMSSEFSETIDFFERRITVLDNALSHLKSTMDSVSGSFGKNKLIDAELSITEEKFNNYSDALSMYTQKADEAFAKIPADIASKVKDGAVSLNGFIGEHNKDVVEAINAYESWAGKVSDCRQNLAELKSAIRQLELEKFNNIISDFTNRFDLRENSKDLLSKLIDLFKEAGEFIGESFYTAQIDQSQKQLKLLEEEKAQLIDRMTDAVTSGRIQKGTGEWLEMVNALSDVDGNILTCRKSIEEYDNAILDLHTEVFDRIQTAFGNISDEISNLICLMEDSDVGLSDGSWTKEGLTQLGLYAQQYELAKYQVSQYAEEIQKLNAGYLDGRYSAAEYADRLADLSSAQWDAVNAAESAKGAIVDLNKARVDIATDAIQEQIDSYKELTDAQIKALQAEKDLHDYEKSLAEKEKDIAKLRKQISAMQNDNSAATAAKRKQLEEQLAEALADLEETQYQHSMEAQEEALNQQYESYEETRNAEIEALENSLKDEERLISDSLNAVKRNTEIISGQILQVAADHGVSISNELVTAWKSGENAIASYGEVLSAETSAFIGQIQSVEAQIYQLQSDADAAAATFANLFAAKADNLVAELVTSYTAETNLYYMTQALQNSLTAALEGGYDVSGIVNSLNKIKETAEDTKKSLDEIGSTENIPDTPISSKKPAKISNEPFVPIAYDDGSDGKIKKKNSGGGESSSFSATFYPYADGSPDIAEDQIAVTNEDGQEIIYHARDKSLLTRLSAGDKVFDNASVNKLWDISHDRLPDFLSNLLPSLPQYIPYSVPPVVTSVNFPDRTKERPMLHYDSLVTINGDVNDTDHFIKQMAKVADQQITKSWKKFNDEFKY